MKWNPTRKKKNNWKQIARVAAIALAVLAIAIVQLKTKDTTLAKDAQPKFQSPAAAGSALALAAGNGDEPTLRKSWVSTPTFF